MIERTFHRGAVVRQPITFKGAPIVWDIVNAWELMPKRKGWQLTAATREAYGACCWSAIEQYGRSSQRNRLRKRGPISRFGRKS